jgi:RNA polymerase sigma-70 factor (ECF subfamily)
LAESDPRDDRALIEAANRGDDAAFEALYYRYRDWVVRLAYRFTANHEDALDVLQDTFAYFLRKFPGFRLSAKMTTFLYPVVKNLSLGLLRKRKRYVIDDDLLRRVPAREPEGSRADLAAVLGILPQAQQEVLLMRFVDGMRLGEIAEALAIPLGTVKSRLHNALGTLRSDARTRAYFEEG